jgi:hypothetical protein
LIIILEQKWPPKNVISYLWGKAYFEVSNLGVIVSGLIIYSDALDGSALSLLLDFFLLFFSPASAIASKMCQKKEEDLQASKLKMM